MYAASLRRNGFCTLQAERAADGYRLATELHPVAIVSDLRLPGEDGLALARRVKQGEGMPDTFLVLLTGSASSAEREAAAQAGCDLLLVKPCLPDVLSRTVAGLIARCA
jgi:CheY-like chemotaxis protein